MKKNALFLSMALLISLSAGYLAWGSRYSSEPRVSAPAARVTFELTPLTRVKSDVKEYRLSLPNPVPSDSLYGFYISYSLFDKNFGSEGLFHSDIASLKRPGGTNSAGVYYAKRGSENFNYLVFSNIKGNQINDAENHIYRIKGLNINIHKVLQNHMATNSSDVEILTSHRTCQPNCPNWYPGH